MRPPLVHRDASSWWTNATSSASGTRSSSPGHGGTNQGKRRAPTVTLWRAPRYSSLMRGESMIVEQWEAEDADAAVLEQCATALDRLYERIAHRSALLLRG